jgi:hypothetical protein
MSRIFATKQIFILTRAGVMGFSASVRSLSLKGPIAKSLRL